ncbi:PRC-barrel domain-containing protein [Pseudochelatococcus sp. G4_1912]|uniref:PRC-barrel domain-containing protein n=1 Tax=Pseudochelatococcus sp. G4_1912 TaxID=3114288 RepID=UPI0039C66B3C
MRKIVFGAILLSSAALIAPAMAQTAPTPTAPPMVKPVSTNSVLSSNLIGLNVANAGNENIGEVKDLVLGTGNMLTGVILSVGGFLGMGEHYVVIDPSTIAVSYNDADKKWEARVNATAEQLKAAPAFKYEGKWQ